MTDWCPENDGAYRAEMAAMYPVQNRKRIDELEAKLEQAVRALRFIGCEENDEGRHARAALSALEENK